MTEWVNKMMSVKHNKHNLTDYVRRVGGWDERERQCVWGAQRGVGEKHQAVGGGR